MKNAVKCGAIGLVLGEVLSALLYFLGSCVECHEVCVSCFPHEYTPVFGDFWLWEGFFTCFVITSIGGFFTGFIYGYLSKDDKTILNFSGIVLMLASGFISVVVYLLAVFFRWFVACSWIN